jgi:hypothetical protein
MASTRLVPNGGDMPDDKMYFPNEKSQSEKLEEMGFPEQKKNSSVHPFYFCHAYF